MIFTIKHQLPGRIRLQCPDYSFDLRSAVGLEAELLTLPGVTKVKANKSTATVLLCFDTDLDVKDLLSRIRKIDIAALTLPPTAELRLSNKILAHNLGIDLLKRTLWRYALRLMPAPLAFVRWPLTLIKAYPYLKAGLSSLLHGKLDLPVLDAGAILISLLQGSTSEASNIIYLLGISSALEEYTMEKAKNTLADSLALTVDQVWKVVSDEAGEQVEVVQCAAADIAVGDVVRVETGMTIPFDGRVLVGEAMINQAGLTGEAEAVFRNPGTSVLAGTAVEEGSLDIEVRQAAGTSRIHQIMQLLEQAGEQKSDLQSKAEKLADHLVPYNFAFSALVWLLTGKLSRVAATMMVDYSCALKLALPIAVISAMETAATRHVAIKGGNKLESFAGADTIVFDKTGTLTTSEPELQAVYPLTEEFSREEVLRIAACLEEHFPHSLATAVVRAAKCEGLVHAENHSKVNYIVAHGIVTEYDGIDARIGSAHFILEDSGIALSATAEKILRNEAAGFSNLFLAFDHRLIGILSIDEPVREEAAAIIGELRRLGFNNMLMMTGDGTSAAARVAKKLGLDGYYAECLPEDKVRYLKELKAAGHTVVMVGDGVNDSPALATADVSAAMRDASALARQAADISLLSDDLAGLIELRNLAVALQKRSRRTYRFIMGFNSLLLLAGAAALLSPATLSLLHNGSTMAICAANLLPYPEFSASKATLSQSNCNM